MPTWVDKVIVLAIHDELLAEHGGPAGLRDEAGLESSLAKPVNLALYDNPDVCELAAAYAVGLGQRQSFIDGNKRVSAVVTELFLNLNGLQLEATDADIVATWRLLADNKITQSEMADWLRARVKPNSPG